MNKGRVDRLTHVKKKKRSSFIFPTRTDGATFKNDQKWKGRRRGRKRTRRRTCHAVRYRRGRRERRGEEERREGKEEEEKTPTSL